MQMEQAAEHAKDSGRCAEARTQLKTHFSDIRSTTIRCNEANQLVETSMKKSASASAAAAAIEVAKATAKQEEERVDSEESGNSVDDQAAGAAATGGAATGGQEEQSDNADTYAGCALDVMSHAKHVATDKRRKKKSLWSLVSVWALEFCKAEAESARSRATLVGRPFHVDTSTACKFASDIFLETKRGAELETTLKFCRTLRQFTGAPSEGLAYDRRKQHILPKAPLSLRPEASTSTFTYGPGPITRTSERSGLEWYGNNEETLRLRHNKYGRGNMDYLMAPQDADLAARADQPEDMIHHIEASFASKWVEQQRRKGVKFVEEPEDIVLEPNRQLKVPTPLHRLVGATGVGVGGEGGQETGGESSDSETGGGGGDGAAAVTNATEAVEAA
jgi:hypothetical protein